jgi:predicted DCC family thiol-disulfide oxidoreductase YuxK
MKPNYVIEMFYDGECPLCVRETRLLERMDHSQRIRFTNIAASDFDASSFGKTQDALMAEMHGRLPDGSWVTGVEVFRRLYSAVGFGPVVWLTRLPFIKQILDAGYVVFAKYRLQLNGRCNENCSIGTTKVAG